MRPFFVMIGIAAVLGVGVVLFASQKGPAPAIDLVDLDGHAVNWDRFRGKVVLVDFWATWYPPCRRSMPELQAVHQRWQERDFTVLGISVDQYGAAPVEKFIAEHGLTYPIAIDDPQNPASARWGVSALPTAFLVDREGRIVRRWTGVADLDELDRRLSALLGD